MEDLLIQVARQGVFAIATIILGYLWLAERRRADDFMRRNDDIRREFREHLEGDIAYDRRVRDVVTIEKPAPAQEP